MGGECDAPVEGVRFRCEWKLETKILDFGFLENWEC